ncbi:MAG: hypothetical protein NTY47_02755, partial [Candidatus Omnitrophica bacterium]|nr:hypothetical protein [Candidatus Omnitrophota bacterium]
MSEIFIQPTDVVLESLIQVFKLQNKLATVSILENAHARIEETDYDNWDGGIYYFTLFLDIPLKLYVYHEQNIGEFEQSIVKKLTSILRDTGNQRLSHVIIAPILAKPAAGKSTPKPTDDDVSRIWGTKGLRLFLSHIATHKVEVTNLKSELGIYGICGFVAHDDIKP